jgi:hypothetical protein
MTPKGASVRKGAGFAHGTRGTLVTIRVGGSRDANIRLKVYFAVLTTESEIASQPDWARARVIVNAVDTNTVVCARVDITVVDILGAVITREARRATARHIDFEPPWNDFPRDATVASTAKLRIGTAPRVSFEQQSDSSARRGGAINHIILPFVVLPILAMEISRLSQRHARAAVKNLKLIVSSRC